MLLQVCNFNFINGNYSQLYVSPLIHSFFVSFLGAPGNKRFVTSVDVLIMHKMGHYASQTPSELLQQILEVSITGINFWGKK